MSKTGRYFVTGPDGRKFCVEPLEGGRREKWGDVDPSSGKLMGNYGSQGGAIRPEDSIITEENGFKNIVVLPPGSSPDSYIRGLCDEAKSVGD